MAMKILFGAATDVGQLRENNEDALLTYVADIRNDNNRPPFGLFVVADGMGGHLNGEKASAIATETVLDDVVRRVYLRILSDSDDGYQPPIGETLESAAETANKDVRRKVPNGGTTLTAAVILGNLLYIAHVGDSRAYMHRDGELEQVTEDHTFVNRLVQMGTMTSEEAAKSEASNRIYKAIGIADSVEIDTITRRIKPGTALLLCSDGLSGMVSDEAMQEVLNSTDDPQRACDMLVDLGNQNGGQDNITVIVVLVIE